MSRLRPIRARRIIAKVAIGIAFAIIVFAVYSLFWNVIYIPLWIPFLLLALPAALLWRHDRRRRAFGACTCGYNLTGNVSGRCPECGIAATEAATRTQP